LQKMAEAEELEAIERERARRRQIELAGKRNSDLEEMLPQGDGTTRRAPQTRDKVAAAVGLGSGRTYDKAADVVRQVRRTLRKYFLRVQRPESRQSSCRRWPWFWSYLANQVYIPRCRLADN